MTPELIKAFAEAGLALTVVIITGAIIYRLIPHLFTLLTGTGAGSTAAWREAVELISNAITENTTAINGLVTQYQEDRRFWATQIAVSQERVLKEIRRELNTDETNGSKRQLSTLQQQPDHAVEPKARLIGFARNAQSRTGTTPVRAVGRETVLDQSEQLAGRHRAHRRE